MKLYATVTSERASKGQGGNDWLCIKLTVQNGSRQDYPIGEIILDYNDDVKNHGVNQNEWVLKYQAFNKGSNDLVIIDQGNIEPPKTKGNPYDYSKTPTAKLEKELKEFQAFLDDENSSIGRRDFIMEQAMIKELEKRDKEKGKKQKGENPFKDWNNNLHVDGKKI